MKKIIIIASLIFSQFEIFAKDNSILEKSITPISKFVKGTFFNAKPINITVTVSGYTINISGSIDYNIWTKKATIHATISITGNGVNLSLPFNYTGPLSSTQIKTVTDDFPTDQQISDFVVSCIDFNTFTIVYPNNPNN